jgi:hypothetical protein
MPQALEEARLRCPHVKAFVPKPYDHARIGDCIEKLLAAQA